MTRINLIAPALLTNKQILAEYRELPRIINRLAAGNPYKNIPAQFTMGKGHESFFGNKLWFLHKRHIAILAELARRQRAFPDRFKGPYIINTEAAWNQCTYTQPMECKDWEPTKRDILISMGRLFARQFEYKTPDRWGDKTISRSTVWQVWAKHVALVLDSFVELGSLFRQIELEKMGFNPSIQN